MMIPASQHSPQLGYINLARVASLIDRIDYTAGLTTYADYHQLLRVLAEQYSTRLENVVGAFVALSPNNDYVNNLRSLVSVLEGLRHQRSRSSVTVSTYKACRDRALDYASGRRDFLLSTTGPKTRAFFLNIMDPTDPKPVTVDGHMVSCWFGQRLRMVEAAYSSWDYDVIAEGVRQLAAEMHLLPNQLQAMLWFTWKRINNIVYSPQLDLFEDHWKNRIDPQRINPFMPKAAQPRLDFAPSQEQITWAQLQLEMVPERMN